jgi:hypothetical protein
MNVEIRAEAALFPEMKHKWDFRCSVDGTFNSKHQV